MQREVRGNLTVWKTKSFVDKFIFWFYLGTFSLGLVIGTYKHNFGVVAFLVYTALVFWTIQTLHTKEAEGEYWVFQKWWQKANYVLAFLLFLFLVLTLLTWGLVFILKAIK